MNDSLGSGGTGDKEWLWILAPHGRVACRGARPCAPWLCPWLLVLGDRDRLDVIAGRVFLRRIDQRELVDDVEAARDLAEDRVLAVQRRVVAGRDEELTAVARSRATAHADSTLVESLGRLLLL